MDASFVNPFVQGAQRVFATICQEMPSLGKIFVKPKPYYAEKVSVSVGIIGAFEGEVVYTMNETAGLFVVGRMMMGLQVPSLHDSMAQSAICELANIISGNVATIFSCKEIAVDIKPPALRFGAVDADFPTMQKIKKVVCVPLQFQGGHVFEVDVMIV